MRMILAAAAILLVQGAVTATHSAERLPALPKRTPYAEARRSLAALGWTPVKLPGADVCMEGDERCQGRPEMEACAGTGLANCNFTWRRADTLIVVGTIGEVDPIVVGIRCRAGCR